VFVVNMLFEINQISPITTLNDIVRITEPRPIGWLK